MPKGKTKVFTDPDNIEKTIEKFRLNDMPSISNWETNKTSQLESIHKVLELLSGYSYENAAYVLSVCKDVIKQTSEHTFPKS